MLSEQIVRSLINEAKKNNIKKLYLFGSRARRDHDEKSDIDLAAYGGRIDLFKLDIEENVPTLLKFDVVDMDNTTSTELIENVEKDGVVLYEEV